MQALQEAMGEVVRHLPEDYDARRAALAEMFDTCRQQVAAGLEPAFNAKAKDTPHDTYEDKKTLAKWVNAELRRFGLAIWSPRTGDRCFLMGNPGGTPGAGRFVLEYTDKQGKRQHPLTSVSLPHLDLMPDEMTRAPYGERTRER